ncbi:septum site-determining protein Ssd [Nocardioides iriomotensis]|uniref:Septum site determining protein n=1 Tax=Nocardioides iriomotensis TaxID=715784 RepID=A0A4Q5J9I3_9ACTN|nr:septum site-determining protein Ssd [Nocardioides iriomotensis]RYU14579.1 septum site determining protein [Nocardioides iriomotensis]
MDLPVLLATRDDALLGDLLRLAAAAGVTLDVAPDPASALRSWSSAALVLVGPDAAAELAPHQPVRHDDVHVVGTGPLPDRVFRDAVAVGARDVVELPAAEPWLVELLGDVADGSSATALTIGVLPGSGGAGASTFAAALGQVAARGAPAVLVDLDPWGPGLGRLLGYDEIDGVRWDGLLAAHGRLGSRALRDALPARDGLALLGFGGGFVEQPDDAVVREVLAAAQRSADVLVLDLPRTAVGQDGSVAGTALSRCDAVVLLAHATVSGVASAARVASRLGTGQRVGGVVVRTSAGAVDPVRVAGALDLPLLADYPTRRRVVEHVDLGLGPVPGGRSSRGPLATAARDVLRALGGRR